MFARRSLYGLLATLLATGGSLALVGAPPAGAAGATFTVNTTADDSDANAGDGVCATAAAECSIRAAFEEAHASHENGVTITVNVPAGDYVLHEELSTYQINVAFHGAGAASTIVTVDHTENTLARHMQLNADGEIDVTLTDMTFKDGFESGGGSIIVYNGNLTLQRMEFVHNGVRGAGGAIEHLDGELTVEDTTFEGNSATELGGAIYVDRFTDLTVANSTFTANGAAFGGALWAGEYPENEQDNGGATADLAQVTMAGNLATGLQGDPAGGAIGVGPNGDVTVTASIIENSAEGEAPVVPSAVGDPVDNCTVIDGGSLSSGGENVVDDDTCSPDESDQVGVSAGVAALADNGGPTRTMALTATSPATDEAVAECDLTVDQRGVARPQDGNNDGTTACDAGAFELEPVAEGPPAALPVQAPAPFTG